MGNGPSDAFLAVLLRAPTLFCHDGPRAPEAAQLSRRVQRVPSAGLTAGAGRQQGAFLTLFASSWSGLLSTTPCPAVPLIPLGGLCQSTGDGFSVRRGSGEAVVEGKVERSHQARGSPLLSALGSGFMVVALVYVSFKAALKIKYISFILKAALVPRVGCVAALGRSGQDLSPVTGSPTRKSLSLC